MANSTFILLILTLLTQMARAQKVFDITQYGATPNKDISEVLVKVWKEACKSSEPSKIVIPKGEWSLIQVLLDGPNKASLELNVQGTIKAPKNPNEMPNKEGQWITINDMDDFVLTGGGVFDGQGQEAWKRNDCQQNPNCQLLPMNLSFNKLKNTVIQDLTTKDSKSFHSNVISSYNVTFQRFTIIASADSPNTDGIHVARSTLVRVLDSNIGTGDDCVSIGDESNKIVIRNVRCGPGHGISIGSLKGNEEEKDLRGIHVENCTFLGTEHGVRIKTWPSSTKELELNDIFFENLIMENVGIPVIIDQKYCPHNHCNPKNPSLVKINTVRITNVTGTTSSDLAVSFVCSPKYPCQDVVVGHVDLARADGAGSITTKCENIQPRFVGKQNPKVCP